MPYNAGQPLREDDDEQPWRPGGNVAGGVPQGAAPGPTGPGQGPGTGGSVGSVGGAGRFVNFGRMFDLNKEKAAKTASNVTSGLDETARQAQGQLGSAQADFARQAGAQGQAYDSMRGMGGNTSQPTSNSTPGINRQSSDQEVTTRGGGTAMTTRGGAPITFDDATARAAQATVSNAGRAWTRDELAAGAGQTYAGPTELDTSALEQSFGGVQDRARALGQPGGIESEVARSMGADPTQSTGNSRWEAGLAGVAGAEGLAAAKNRYKDFAGRLEDARLQARGVAASNQSRVGDQAAAYQRGLTEFDTANATAPEAAPPVPKSDGTFQNQLANLGIGSPGDSRALNNFARELRAEDPDTYEALVNNRLSDEQVAALVRSRQRAPRGGG